MISLIDYSLNTLPKGLLGEFIKINLKLLCTLYNSSNYSTCGYQVGGVKS